MRPARFSATPGPVGVGASRNALAHRPRQPRATVPDRPAGPEPPGLNGPLWSLFAVLYVHRLWIDFALCRRCSVFSAFHVKFRTFSRKRTQPKFEFVALVYFLALLDRGSAPPKEILTSTGPLFVFLSLSVYLRILPRPCFRRKIAFAAFLPLQLGLDVN